jgi:hypothetical protein
MAPAAGIRLQLLDVRHKSRESKALSVPRLTAKFAGIKPE